jgi:hypothetical protein
VNYEVVGHGSIGQTLKDYADHYSKRMPEIVNDYGRNVFNETLNVLSSRPYYGATDDSLYRNIGFEETQDSFVINTFSPHGYLRQYGTTVNGGTMIMAKDKKLFVVLNKAMRLDRGTMEDSELREAYEYGADYIFTNRVRIASNPYIAIEEPLQGVRSVSSEYTGDTQSAGEMTSWQFDAMIDLMMGEEF